jgi:hypothetical protein
MRYESHQKKFIIFDFINFYFISTKEQNRFELQMHYIKKKSID